MANTSKNGNGRTGVFSASAGKLDQLNPSGVSTYDPHITRGVGNIFTEFHEGVSPDEIVGLRKTSGLGRRRNNVEEES